MNLANNFMCWNTPFSIALLPIFYYANPYAAVAMGRKTERAYKRGEKKSELMNGHLLFEYRKWYMVEVLQISVTKIPSTIFFFLKKVLN